jgi:hypothetical protein
MRFVFIGSLVMAVLLTIGPAYYHGLHSFRWGEDKQLLEMASRLENLPPEIVGWKSVKESKLSSIELAQLRPVGYVAREYSSGPLNATMFVLVGPTGPTAAHTPDICFNSRQYRTLNERKKTPIGDAVIGKSECWLLNFESRTVDRHLMKTWYAWTIDGQWHASENPRYTFGDSRFLVKLQIAVFYPDQETMESDTLGQEFVNNLAQHLTRNLFVSN